MSIFTKKDCVIYSRTSTLPQQSLPNQILACRNFATKHGMNLVKIWTESCSGTDFSRMKKIQRVFEWMTSHPGTVLLIYDISRLGRCIDVFNFVEIVIQNGTIHSVSENVTINSHYSFDYARLQKLVCESIAFSIKLSKTMKTSFKLRKQRGICLKRKVPFGFKIVKHKTSHFGKPEKYLVRDPDNWRWAKRLSNTKGRRTGRKPATMTTKQLNDLRRNFARWTRQAAIGQKTVLQDLTVDLERIVL